MDSDTEQDAMRYRWLRNTQNQRMRDNEDAGCIQSIMVAIDEFSAEAPSREELDRCVDREMAKWPLVTWGRNAFTKGVSTEVVVQGERE